MGGRGKVEGDMYLKGWKRGTIIGNPKSTKTDAKTLRNT